MKRELIYGCMGLGGEWNTNPSTKDDFIQAERAIEAALEIGITFFDHADIYMLGKAESIFGNILQNKPSLRDQITLQSKAGICLHEGVGNSNTYNLSKKYILQQVDQILKRLKTDFLDVFLLHRPDPLLVVEEIGEAFRMLKESGKVKSFGVSNMSKPQIKFIQKYCDDPLVANQIQLGLGHSVLLDTGVLVNKVDGTGTDGIEGLLEYAQTNALAIQAYGSLDKGRFTGNVARASEDDKKTIQLVAELAEKYNTTTFAIVLSWLFKIPGMVQPIIGTTNPERILACRDAITIELSRIDWYNLWISARGQRLP